MSNNKKNETLISFFTKGFQGQKKLCAELEVVSLLLQSSGGVRSKKSRGGRLESIDAKLVFTKTNKSGWEYNLEASLDSLLMARILESSSRACKLTLENEEDTKKETFRYRSTKGHVEAF